MYMVALSTGYIGVFVIAHFLPLMTFNQFTDFHALFQHSAVIFLLGLVIYLPSCYCYTVGTC